MRKVRVLGVLTAACAIFFLRLAEARGEVVYRTKICDGDCFWEMVFAGNPNNPLELVHVGGKDSPVRGQSFISRSSDGGRTWGTSRIDDIAVYPRTDVTYALDPKLVTLGNGSFFLSGLVHLKVTATRDVIGGGLFKGLFTGGLSASLFQDLPAPAGLSGLVDFPKVAVNSSGSAVYIATNGQTYTDPRLNHDIPTLYVSSNGGNTFAKYVLSYSGTPMWSIALGADGALYGVYTATPTFNYQLIRFSSVNPPVFDIYPLPAKPGRQLPNILPRLSTSTTQKWQSPLAPQILADTNLGSSHRGRLYFIWAQEDQVIVNTGGEDYGYNEDVFVSYSDDRGQIWSAPARVNDDVGSGDQLFPSAGLDADGVLHVAFIDHRNQQNQAVFDVYYTNSAYSAGDVLGFSQNIRISDQAVPNSISGKSVGDYLDMIVPYLDRVYIAYPCGQNAAGTAAGAACMAQITPPPHVTFSEPSLAFLETSGRVEMPLKLTTPSSSIVTVRVRVLVNGQTTATNGLDYRFDPQDQLVSFLPGETQKTIPITVLDDLLKENVLEYAYLELYDPQYATIGSLGTFTLIIMDNECFIATAAYGTPLAPELDTLRAFRDKVLLKSTAGQAFVDWYYRTSPPVAKFISDKPWLRALVRVGLWPIIHWARHTLEAR